MEMMKSQRDLSLFSPNMHARAHNRVSQYGLVLKPELAHLLKEHLLSTSYVPSTNQLLCFENPEWGMASKSTAYQERPTWNIHGNAKDVKTEICRNLHRRTMTLLMDPRAARVAERFPSSRRRGLWEARGADWQRTQGKGDWIGHNITCRRLHLHHSWTPKNTEQRLSY